MTEGERGKKEREKEKGGWKKERKRSPQHFHSLLGTESILSFFFSASAVPSWIETKFLHFTCAVPRPPPVTAAFLRLRHPSPPLFRSDLHQADNTWVIFSLLVHWSAATSGWMW